MSTIPRPSPRPSDRRMRRVPHCGDAALHQRNDAKATSGYRVTPTDLDGVWAAEIRETGRSVAPPRFAAPRVDCVAHDFPIAGNADFSSLLPLWTNGAILNS